MRDAAGRFQAGVSGNARGRPRDRGLQYEIERALSNCIDGKSRIQAFAEKVVEMAVAGDLRAGEILARRLWPERAAVDGVIAGPTLIQVVTGFDSGPHERGEANVAPLRPVGDSRP